MSAENRPQFYLVVLLVWLATQIVTIIVAIFLFALGLILIEFLLYPLALCVTALFSGLTAAGASNLLMRDHQRAEINALLSRCELVAVLLSLLLIADTWLGWLPGPPILVAIPSAIILALIATHTAVNKRQPIGGPQAWRILILVMVGLAAIPIVILIASLFGWAGA